jgi:hypothetical protein
MLRVRLGGIAEVWCRVEEVWGGGRVPEVSSRCKQCIVVVVCVNRCGNLYLSKGITKESEVADTRGSTATGAPL